MQENESAQAAPVVVAEWDKNKKERLRVSFVEFNGHSLLEIRSYYPAADGAMKPGKGIAIQRAQVATLRKALQEAERLMKDEKRQAAPSGPDTQEEHAEPLAEAA